MISYKSMILFFIKKKKSNHSSFYIFSPQIVKTVAFLLLISLVVKSQEYLQS